MLLSDCAIHQALSTRCGGGVERFVPVVQCIAVATCMGVVRGLFKSQQDGNSCNCAAVLSTGNEVLLDGEKPQTPCLFVDVSIPRDP